MSYPGFEVRLFISIENISGVRSFPAIVGFLVRFGKLLMVAFLAATTIAECEQCTNPQSGTNAK